MTALHALLRCSTLQCLCGSFSQANPPFPRFFWILLDPDCHTMTPMFHRRHWQCSLQEQNQRCHSTTRIYHLRHCQHLLLRHLLETAVEQCSHHRLHHGHRDKTALEQCCRRHRLYPCHQHKAALEQCRRHRKLHPYHQLEALVEQCPHYYRLHPCHLLGTAEQQWSRLR